MTTTDFVSVPLPTELVRWLTQRYPKGIGSIVEYAVRDFLERTTEELPRTAARRPQGIYWGRLFLADSTRLRSRYFGEYRYADVKRDQIIYEGKPVSSVSQLVRRMRNDTSVNAWLHIEILRPSDIEWVKASDLRAANSPG